MEKQVRDFLMAKHSVQVVVAAKDQASRKFRTIGKAGQGMGRMLKTAIAGAVAYMGVRQIISFSKESVEAFARQELAIRELKQALDNLGAGSQIEDMKKFAAEIQKVTTYGDEATMEVMKLGATIGGLAGDQLKAATTAAIGFSKMLNIDLKAAMLLIGKAATGEASSFSRYGIVFEEGMTKAQKYAEVLKRGAEGFKIAQAETDTYAGKVKQLSNTWGDFKESIGKTIATSPRLLKFLQVTQVYIENFRLVMDKVHTTVALAMVKTYENFKHGFMVSWEYLKWFGKNFFNIWVDIASGLKTVITNMAINLGRFFKAMWGWLKGEGFDFKWQGLLDGFESTLTELPQIAARKASDLENALQTELDDINLELAGKIEEKIAGAAFDAAKVIAEAAMPDFKEKIKVAKAKGPGKLEAKEYRFLSMSLAKQDPTREVANNTSTMVKILNRHLQVTELQRKAIEKVMNVKASKAIRITSSSMR